MFAELGSFLGNQWEIAPYSIPANGGRNFLAFSSLFERENSKVTVTHAENVQFAALRHPPPEHSVETLQYVHSISNIHETFYFKRQHA
jgi:hypothetical protein